MQAFSWPLHPLYRYFASCGVVDACVGEVCFLPLSQYFLETALASVNSQFLQKFRQAHVSHGESLIAGFHAKGTANVAFTAASGTQLKKVGDQTVHRVVYRLKILGVPSVLFLKVLSFVFRLIEKGLSIFGLPSESNCFRLNTKLVR